MWAKTFPEIGMWMLYWINFVTTIAFIAECHRERQQMYRKGSDTYVYCLALVPNFVFWL
jgi:hypothetical protein